MRGHLVNVVEVFVGVGKMGTKIACPSTNGHYDYDILSVHDKLQNTKVGKQDVWIHNGRICRKEEGFFLLLFILALPSLPNSVVL